MNAFKVKNQTHFYSLIIDKATDMTKIEDVKRLLAITKEVVQ